MVLDAMQFKSRARGSHGITRKPFIGAKQKLNPSYWAAVSAFMSFSRFMIRHTMCGFSRIKAAFACHFSKFTPLWWVTIHFKGISSNRGRFAIKRPFVVIVVRISAFSTFSMALSMPSHKSGSPPETCNTAPGVWQCTHWISRSKSRSSFFLGTSPGYHCQWFDLLAQYGHASWQ
jgi:hypothetical protein